MSLNATFIAQILVFVFLVLFTMNFVWPPIAKALDERAQKISEGLLAADKARSELVAVTQQVEKDMAESRRRSTIRIEDAERRALMIIEEAKKKAVEEGNNILKAAKLEALQQIAKAKDLLREQVGMLAVKGAEQILLREVDASVHADLLEKLKAEL